MVLPSIVFAQGSGSVEPPVGTEGSVSPPPPADSSTFTLPNPLSSQSITDILDKIIDFMLIVAGPVAVIMTIYAAYLFITAGDNQERIKTARKTLMYVIIGVAILILSKGIVSLTKSFLVTPPAATQVIKNIT